MDKQTTSSNSTSQGASATSGDIGGIGCGPSSSTSHNQATSNATAGASSSSSASATSGGGSSGGGGNTGNTKFTTLATTVSSASLTAPSGGGQLQQQQTAVPPPPIKLNINTTTGGNFSVIVDITNTVENLKKVIAKKLKVAKDRICLLHREKELQDGTLKDNGLMDGSKIILIPNVETGLLAQRPENTVMQALESLNDSQVNDFLSGKTPLNLSMRLGDHMMLIQLQLSTVNPVNTNAHSSSSTRTRSSQRSSRSSSATAAQSGHHNHHHHHHHHHHPNDSATATAATTTPVAATTSRKLDIDAATAAANAAINTHQRQRNSADSGGSTGGGGGGGGTSVIPGLRFPATAGSTIRSSDLSSFLSKRDYESLQNIVRSIAMAQPAKIAAAAAAAAAVQQQTEQLALTPASLITSPTTCCNVTAAGSKVIGSAALPTNAAASTAFHSAEPGLLEQSPIKSLSNLVSSPIKTTAITNIPIANGVSSSSTTSSPSSIVATNSSASALSAGPTATAITNCQDPISAKLTSCLCTRLNATTTNGSNISNGSIKSCIDSSTCQSRHETVETSAMLTSTPNYKSSSSSTAIATSTSLSSSSTSLLHKTANNPIARSKHRHHHHHHHHHHHYHHHGNSSGSSSSSSSGSISNASIRKISVSPRSASVLSTTSSSKDSGFISENETATSAAMSTINPTVQPVTPTVSAAASSPNNTPLELDDSGVTLTDTRTLAEASRNLTQTLRKLSKEVFTNKIDLSSEETPRKSSSGAVIESMKNHGKGIYSGTFSGTLNPALQDRYGRPKRDISTVIHILNDLLSATPQYSRGARISFEAPSTSSAAAASTSGGLSTHATRSKQFPSKHHHHYAHSADSCSKCCSKTQHQNPNTTSNSSSSTTSCAYGECNGHYASKQAKHSVSSSAATTNYNCCQDLSTNSSQHHHNHNHHHHHQHHSLQTADATNQANDRNTCSCRYRIISESGEREREHMCQKCLVEMENNKTKSKLDQLRLVMQQRKQKREARKLKGAPYGARVVGTTTNGGIGGGAGGILDATTTTVAAATATTTSVATTPPLTTPMATASPSEVSPNHIVEEVDTAA